MRCVVRFGYCLLLFESCIELGVRYIHISWCTENFPLSLAERFNGMCVCVCAWMLDAKLKCVSHFLSTCKWDDEIHISCEQLASTSTVWLWNENIKWILLFLLLLAMVVTIFKNDSWLNAVRRYKITFKTKCMLRWCVAANYADWL